MKNAMASGVKLLQNRSKQTVANSSRVYFEGVNHDTARGITKCSR